MASIKINHLFKKIRLEHYLIIFIVLLSLFLRLYRIPSYMTFLGDEGRDALVWLRMVRNLKFTLIGPQTSIGNMYLGPLYYYLMLPFYFILRTTGPSIGVALFAGATTFLLWYFGKQWFSLKVGLLAAFFYAISPIAIVLSHSSWNPNVMPFFALLIIWGVWQFWQKDKYIWIAVEGVLLSFAIQSHYLGLLLIPIIILFWVVILLRLIRSKDKKLKYFLSYSVFGIFLFILLTVIPLVWFDLRHNFINYQSFYKFFSERQTTVNLKAYKAVPQLWPLWQVVVTRLLVGGNIFFGFWISILFGLGILMAGIYTFKEKNKNTTGKNALILMLVWLFVGLIGMGLYKQHIYDHYFGFLFPVLFLLSAYFLKILWKINIIGKIGAFILFISLSFLMIKENPLKYTPNNQIKRTAEVSQKIVDESGGKDFNIGMIAKQNYDAGYRYFLEKWGKKAVDIDAQKAGQTITDQLFVVCEVNDCNPTTHPQAEIANFGWSKIDKEWDFPWGVKLYRLVHYEKK